MLTDDFLGSHTALLGEGTMASQLNWVAVQLVRLKYLC